MKVVILNGYKMILPHYGKYNSLYGMFTSEGFVYCNDFDNCQDIVIEEIKYNKKLNIDAKEYEKLNFPEY